MADSNLVVRFVDFRTLLPTPSEKLQVELEPDEKIVSVETIKDLYGYATARVWITNG